MIVCLRTLRGMKSHCCSWAATELRFPPKTQAFSAYLASFQRLNQSLVRKRGGEAYKARCGAERQAGVRNAHAGECSRCPDVCVSYGTICTVKYANGNMQRAAAHGLSCVDSQILAY